jgi:hypothetical protein
MPTLFKFHTELKERSEASKTEVPKCTHQGYLELASVVPVEAWELQSGSRWLFHLSVAVRF